MCGPQTASWNLRRSPRRASCATHRVTRAPSASQAGDLAPRPPPRDSCARSSTSDSWITWTSSLPAQVVHMSSCPSSTTRQVRWTTASSWGPSFPPNISTPRLSAACRRRASSPAWLCPSSLALGLSSSRLSALMGLPPMRRGSTRSRTSSSSLTASPPSTPSWLQTRSTLRRSWHATPSSPAPSSTRAGQGGPLTFTQACLRHQLRSRPMPGRSSGRRTIWCPST
mmetsp:Transcript_13918/g.37390  ORF Transcript_13918/g.37390 Transcript_13918/m.37390 type:complete len:226 (+) Transcript_13918:118-795(+)